MTTTNIKDQYKRINFFSAEINPLTMGQTMDVVEEMVQARVPQQHVVVNVAKLVMMEKDEQLRKIVNSCDLINADGQGVVWGAKILGVDIPERVAGIDLFTNLIELSANKGYRVYLFGAKEEVVSRVSQIFKEKFPKLTIAGSRNGYFTKEEELKIVEDIHESKPDMLFVAMSSPQKEIFLNKYKDKMNVPFVMGVGGSFDVIAGKTKRAPLWMQKCGLEWFYRFLCEPRRMWKRYLVTNSIFLGMIIKAKIRGKR